MACKTRQNGLHGQLTFTSQNLFLQQFLVTQPSVGQRTLKSIDIRHAVPSQVCRSGEIVLYIVFVQADFLPHFQPNGFLSGDGKRHVDAIESHPVNHTLPIVPFPIRHSVAKSAIVQEETTFAHCSTLHLFLRHWQGFGQHHLVVCPPRHTRVAQLHKILVQPHSHRVGTVSFNQNLAFTTLHRVAVYVKRVLQLLKSENLRFLAKHSAAQISSRLLGRRNSRHGHRRDNDKCEKDAFHRVNI